MKASLRASFAVLASSVALLVASTALAEGEACFNDDDCPGTACGDAVCNWPKMSATPMGDKVFYCNPAGTQPRGSDGWCTDDTDCKCKAQGAKCVGTYCSFTKASDAPAGTGGGGAGGAASTAGATSTGGGGSGTAGTTGGSTSTAGTAATTSAGTSSAPAAEDSGGCSVGAPRGNTNGVALGLGLLGLGYALARRRR